MKNNCKTLKNNNIFKSIILYVGLAMVFFTPLVFSASHFFKFNTPKIILVLSSVFLMSFLYLIERFRDDKFKIFLSPTNILVLFFVGVLALSSFLGLDSLNSFLGMSNTVPVIVLLALGIFTLIMSSLVRGDRSAIKKILFAIFLSGVFSMIFFYTGLPEPLGKIDGSTTGNSSYLGAFLIFAIGSGLSLVFLFKNIFNKIFTFAGLGFLIFNPLFFNKDFLLLKIPFSEIIEKPLVLAGIANGAALGVFVMIAVSVLLFLVYSKNKKIKITGIILGAIFLFLVFLAGFSLVKEGSIVNKVFVENKTNNRLLAWNIARETWEQNPLLGIGPNNFVYSFEKFYSPDFYKKGYAIERLTSPHNIFWEFMANTGTTGAFSYFVLFAFACFVLLHRAIKKDDGFFETKIILFGLLVGYLIHNFFVFDTVISYTCFFAILSCVSAFGGGFLFERNSKILLILKKVLIFIFLVLIILAFKFFVLDLYKESYKMNRIMYKVVTMKDFAKEREGVSEISVFGGVMEYTLQAEKLFKLYQSSLSKIDDKNKIVFLSEIKSLVKNLDRLIEKQPNYADSYLVSSELLNLYLLAEGKEGLFIKIDKNGYDRDIWNESFDKINKSLELNPSNPQNYMVLSQLYMIGSDFDKSFVYAKKYLEMAPEYDKSYEYAKSLLKVYPNENFRIFVENMENIWIKK